MWRGAGSPSEDRRRSGAREAASDECDLLGGRWKRETHPIFTECVRLSSWILVREAIQPASPHLS